MSKFLRKVSLLLQDVSSTTSVAKDQQLTPVKCEVRLIQKEHSVAKIPLSHFSEKDIFLWLLFNLSTAFFPCPEPSLHFGNVLKAHVL